MENPNSWIQIALVNQLVAIVSEVAEENIDGISVGECAQQLLKSMKLYTIPNNIHKNTVEVK